MSDRRSSETSVIGRQVFVLAMVVWLIANLLNAVAIAQWPWADPHRVWFILDAESNLGTWLSSAVLLMSACLALAGRVRGHVQETVFWTILAAVFGLMSLDEVATVHEQISTDLGDGSGLLTFMWVIPGAIAALSILVLVALRAPKGLPVRFWRGLVISAALYVSGALVMEGVTGLWIDDHGKENIGYLLHTTVEENLEMLGAFGFVWVLGRHLGLWARLRDLDA